MGSYLTLQGQTRILSSSETKGVAALVQILLSAD